MDLWFGFGTRVVLVVSLREPRAAERSMISAEGWRQETDSLLLQQGATDNFPNTLMVLSWRTSTRYVTVTGSLDLH